MKTWEKFAIVLVTALLGIMATVTTYERDTARRELAAARDSLATCKLGTRATTFYRKVWVSTSADTAFWHDTVYVVPARLK